MAETTGLEPATSGVTGRNGGVASDCEISTCTGTPEPVTPNVTPDSKMDPKERLLEALRGVDRETLLAVLADVLAGGGLDGGKTA